VVQRYVLDRIDDDRLRTYVVWGPMQGGETRQKAEEATESQSDPRATHFWTGAQVVAERLQGPAGLEDELAWDTFLLYPPGARWEGKVPPEPAHVMHVGKSLPAADRLNGEKLYQRAGELIETGPSELPDAAPPDDGPRGGEGERGEAGGAPPEAAHEAPG